MIDLPLAAAVPGELVDTGPEPVREWAVAVLEFGAGILLSAMLVSGDGVSDSDDEAEGAGAGGLLGDTVCDSVCFVSG